MNLFKNKFSELKWTWTCVLTKTSYSCHFHSHSTWMFLFCESCWAFSHALGKVFLIILKLNGFFFLMLNIAEILQYELGNQTEQTRLWSIIKWFNWFLKKLKQIEGWTIFRAIMNQVIIAMETPPRRTQHLWEKISRMSVVRCCVYTFIHNKIWNATFHLYETFGVRTMCFFRICNNNWLR